MAFSSAACGEDESHVAGTGGHGQGGAGGESCGARDTSDDETFAELLDFVEAWRAGRGIPGVAVGVALREGDGWVEHTGGLGVRTAGECDPITPDTLFRDPFAASYLSTELAALVAVDRGDLDLDAPITEVVPTFSVALQDHGVAADVTLRQLLDGTAGLPGAFYWYAGTANTFLADPCGGSGELAALFDGVDYELFFPPGTQWEYSDAARSLAGLAIENVVGKPFADALRDDVFTKLELTATYDPAEAQARDFAAPHPSGSAMACRAAGPATGVYASLRDALALLEQIDRSALVSDATWTARFQPAPQASPRLKSDYPLGGSIPLPGGVTLVDASAASPGYQSCVMAVPERGFAVAVLANLSSSGGWREPCEKAVELFTNIRVESYDEGTAPATWDEYTGVYVDPIGTGDGPRQVEVVLDGGALVARLSVVGDTAVQESQLDPASIWVWFADSPHAAAIDPDVFALATGQTVRFWRDDTGVPTSVGGTAWGTIGPHFFRAPAGP
jgi:CubicO group peptidase (beta-lactamase class C family)